MYATLCFLHKKINIQLIYVPWKFGNSEESNSCPGSPVKGSTFRRLREKSAALACMYHTMGLALSWKRIMHFKAEKLLHFLRYVVSFLFCNRFSALYNRDATVI